jgi:hypothetical protein
VRTIPSDAAAAKRNFPWIAFEGRRGERREAFYNGPTGPNFKRPWIEPIVWAEEDSRDRSYMIPAGGLFGTTATELLLDGTGSDVLRRTVDARGRTLFVAGNPPAARGVCAHAHDVEARDAAASPLRGRQVARTGRATLSS